MNLECLDLALFCIFLNFGWKTQSWLCKKNRGVIKLISIHFGYSSRFHVAFVIKRLLCVEIREY